MKPDKTERLQASLFRDKKELLRLKEFIDLAGDSDMKRWLKELYTIKYQRVWQKETKLREMKREQS